MNHRKKPPPGAPDSLFLRRAEFLPLRRSSSAAGRLEKDSVSEATCRASQCWGSDPVGTNSCWNPQEFFDRGLPIRPHLRTPVAQLLSQNCERTTGYSCAVINEAPCLAQLLIRVLHRCRTARRSFQQYEAVVHSVHLCSDTADGCSATSRRLP